MADREILIIRTDMVLGSLPESDVRQLLELGFFRPDDMFWCEGMPERRPLAEFPAAAAGADSSGPAPSWLERARQTAADVTGALASSASGIAGRLKSLATEKTPVVTQATNRLLEDYLPQIRKAVRGVTKSKPVQSIKSGVHDDAMMRKTFGAAYDCLPRPICRFVSEERFVTFCLERRNGLLGSEAAEEKENTDASSSPASSEIQPLGGS